MRRKGLIAYIAVFVALLVPICSGAEELIARGETLTLDRCIEIALGKNPSLLFSKNTLSAAETRTGQARSSYYPQIDWQAGYNRFFSAGTRLGIRTTTEGNYYSTGPSLTQNIYDFGRTASQVKIAGLGVDASRSDLESVENGVALDVKAAYYGVLQAKRSRDVASEVVRQFEEHLERAEGFYKAGAKPRIDVTRAEVDLSNARLNLIRAENGLHIARTTLNNAMGVPDAPEYEIEDNLEYEKYEITFEEAIERAYRDRPDLRASIARGQTSERSLDFARSGYYPVLTGNASYSWVGDDPSLEDREWTVGAAVSIPVFSGFLTKKQVEEAEANLGVSSASTEALRQQIFLQTRQAHLNLNEAESSLATAELGLKQAQENLDLANGRYEAGVGSPIEVTDALVAFANAKTSYINVLYNYRIARASLENAMGSR
jgi:TolC family type I secretion outer membrane protein